MLRIEDVLFISFYTPNYAEPAKRLVASLDFWGLQRDVEAIPDMGGWRKAVCFKPEFIRRKMVEHPERKAVVWIDADGYVVRRPDLFFALGCDMAFHFWQYTLPLCGTLYVRNTRKVRAVLADWAVNTQAMGEDAKCPEQNALKGIALWTRLRVWQLPMVYCMFTNRDAVDTEDAYILHDRWERQSPKHAEFGVPEVLALCEKHRNEE